MLSGLTNCLVDRKWNGICQRNWNMSVWFAGELEWPPVVVAAGGGCRWRLTVVAVGHFCHLEKLRGNGIEFHQIWEGMMNSLNQGIHGIEFHSIGNQTTQWN